MVPQAANEMYERKLDVDNEQGEQVDEKRKCSPELPLEGGRINKSASATSARVKTPYEGILEGYWALYKEF